MHILDQMDASMAEISDEENGGSSDGNASEAGFFDDDDVQLMREVLQKVSR